VNKREDNNNEGEIELYTGVPRKNKKEKMNSDDVAVIRVWETWTGGP